MSFGQGALAGCMLCNQSVAIISIHSPQALVIAKEIPTDHSPLSYVIKLRDTFPLLASAERSCGTGGHSGDRLLERIEELERRLTLARADEAHAKLELLEYRAKHPVPAPVASEGEVAGTSSDSAKRPAPSDSPSSGPKKPAKKKKKQVDAGFGGVESRLAQLDMAVGVIQKSFDVGTHLKSVGLVASLIRLKGAQTITEQPSIGPLLQRCLTDVSTYIRHICAHPTIQTSLDSLNALQTLLPELLTAIHTPPNTDCSTPELTRILARDLIEPILHAIHPASTALISRAGGATRSRTRRGKLKTGARASREAEEGGKALIDVRPGLLNVLCIVASAVRGGGMLYAVLPLACRLVRELVASTASNVAQFKHRPGSSSAPGVVASARTAHRMQRFAAADSLWYLASACHAVLEHSTLSREDTELLSRCSEMLVAALTQAVEGGTGEAVRDVLCAVLERITLSFPL